MGGGDGGGVAYCLGGVGIGRVGGEVGAIDLGRVLLNGVS